MHTLALKTADFESSDEVIVSVEGSALCITLNRAHKLNALTTSMCQTIEQAVQQANKIARQNSDNKQNQPLTCIIFSARGERGFCGGGDIKMMAESAQQAQEFLNAEYAMDRTIAESFLPTIAFMSGVTMGGGLGIAGHCTLRVADSSTLMAMPETRIGIVPDVGMNRVLAQTPPGFGELIAATSLSFGPADALAAGFANAYVDSLRQWQTLRAHLISAVTAGQVRQIIKQQIMQTAYKGSRLDLNQSAATAPITAAGPAKLVFATQQIADFLENVDAPGDPLAMLRGLQKAVQTNTVLTGAQQLLKEVCPLAAAVALSRVIRQRKKGVQTAAEALAWDLPLVSALCANPNFIEGVRARIIDKDSNPRWQPGSVGELMAGGAVIVAEVEELLALGGHAN